MRGVGESNSNELILISRFFKQLIKLTHLD